MEVAHLDTFTYIINNTCFLTIGIHILSYFLLCDYIEPPTGSNVNFVLIFNEIKKLCSLLNLTKSRAYTTQDRPTLRAIERSFTEFES